MSPSVPPTRRYRVVQWATGNIGTKALRAVIEHPGMELVGVHVYDDAKVGRDAGELCGLAPVGVRATRDLDAVCALEPDCVLYMASRTDLDVICRLLASGANVVTTRSELHRPASLEPAVRERIEAACATGRATLHSTGSSPGFITEALPIVLTSLQRRLDHLAIDEFADVSSRPSPELLFSVMGFGRDPTAFDARRWAHGAAAFGPSLGVLTDAIGLPLDAVTSTGEVAVARRRLAIAAGVVEAGTVAAQRMVVTGLRGGRPLVRFVAHWYVSTEVEPAWDLRETGWRVVVDGDTPLDVSIRFPVPPERYAATSPGYTAHRAVNAIPAVCQAPPGILTSTDLPQIIASLG
jgi:4-hydroxy-tetrahydrodipicolinate reductase